VKHLEEKVALVIGGGASGTPKPGEQLPIGNGRAIAILAAREGARVVVADINLDLATETVEVIRREGGNGIAVACDATQEADCRAAVEAAAVNFGALHLLANVVGLPDRQSIFDVDLDTFDRICRLNLRSNLLTMKFAVPEMVKAGGGAIVNVSSISAYRGGGGIAYETTKAAQLGLTRSVAVSAAKQNIRANAVVLGTIDTPMLHNNSTPELRDRRLQRIPLGRFGTPWEVASAVVFLLSDEAGYITGMDILVDGGSFRAAP
jgi:NAD(P)-dependent dehydrogenase (short-subunit alcohol dehydrogenase family)